MSSVFRAGGISYLRIPVADPRRSAAFYAAVFGWKVRTDRDDPSFEDGTGHVIGHFVADQPVAGEAGLRPYVFVESLDEMLALMQILIERAAAGSQFIVEADERFDFKRLPRPDDWLVRAYPPAVVGILRLGESLRNDEAALDHG